MDAIDELIDAAQTFYEDARRDEWALALVGALLSRVSRSRTEPLPGLRLARRPAPRLHLASWGYIRGSSFLLQDYKGACAHRRKILKPEYDCLFGVACADLRNSDVRAQLKQLYDGVAEHFGPDTR